MNVIHYIGLDVHKKSISYCIKTTDGRIVREGRATWPNLQTTKRLATDSADRSGQAGAAMESAFGRTTCQTIGAGPSQPGYAARARKLVAYLLAVDKSGQPFQVLTPPPTVENATKTKRRKRALIAKAA